MFCCLFHYENNYKYLIEKNLIIIWYDTLMHAMYKLLITWNYHILGQDM